MLSPVFVMPGPAKYPAVLYGVEKGLFAKAVTRAEEATLLVVPQGKGKHAVKARKAVWAPDAVALKNNLGIRACLKAATEGGELLFELGIVVYFAVEGDGKLPIGAVHGLAAARKVNDGKPPVSQAYGPVAPLALAIRAAMGHAVGHGLDPLPRLRREGGGIYLTNACYAAHFCFQIV